jgi:hypoxia-inducible factor 1-alpha inhibitor (HIF hydroxylase)
MEVDRKDDGKMEVEGQMESKQQQQGSPVIVGKVDVLREEGNNYFKQGDFLKAKKCYEQGIEELKNSGVDSDKVKELMTTLYCNLASVCIKLKNLEEAAEACFQAMSYQPNSSKAYLRRASVYLEMGNFIQAQVDLEKSLSLDPGNKDALTKMEEVKTRAQEPVFEIGNVHANLDTFDDDGVIPRLDYRDPSIYRYIQNELPVILTGCPLVKSALNKWDLNYLAENIVENDTSVYVSKQNQFMYYDEERNSGGYPFEPKTFQIKMSAKQFVSQVENNMKTGVLKLYMQQSLTKECSGPKLVQDFEAFDWAWIGMQQSKLNMGHLKNNTLWVGMPGVVTPLHFDEAHNFFTQVKGRKLFKLYSPKYFPNVYPYPVHHFHDRQCQIDIENPDYNRFPKFRQAKCVQGIVHPGDVLYLPPYWFHYVKSLDVTISVNFWYVMKDDKIEDVSFPLKKQTHIMAFRRNIEKFIAQTMGPANVGTFLEEMFTGRFNPDLWSQGQKQQPKKEEKK